LNQQLITSVILSGGQYYGGVGGSFGGVQSAPADAAQDYLPIGSADAGADAGPYQSAEDVRTADIAALFTGLTGSNARVTRMRSDISHAVMTKDFVLQASADQSELSNVRNVTKSVNLVCPVYPACSAEGNDGTSSGTAPSGTANGDGMYSRAPNENGSAASDGGGGCVASAQSTGGSAASFGALAGLLGLALARVVRSKRRS
jgi:hypothetical protein